MKRRALLSLVVIGLLLLPTAASRTIQSNSNVVVPSSGVTIPFELVNRHVVIQVKVNNSRPLSFVLDTGDKFAIIDLERAKELGLTLQGQLRVGGAGSEQPTVYCSRAARILPAREYRLADPEPGAANGAGL